MPRCWNASAQECAGTDGAEPCHQWPCSLFRTSCIFPSSLLLLQLRTFPSLRYCNLPALISAREALSKSFKRKQNLSRRKIIACWCAKSSYPVLWQHDCITCPARTGNFTCLIIAEGCSSATKPQYWITWSSPAIKSAIHNRIFLL